MDIEAIHLDFKYFHDAMPVNLTRKDRAFALCPGHSSRLLRVPNRTALCRRSCCSKDCRHSERAGRYWILCCTPRISDCLLCQLRPRDVFLSAKEMVLLHFGPFFLAFIHLFCWFYCLIHLFSTGIRSKSTAVAQLDIKSQLKNKLEFANRLIKPLQNSSKDLDSIIRIPGTVDINTTSFTSFLWWHINGWLDRYDLKSGKQNILELARVDEVCTYQYQVTKVNETACVNN